MRNPTSEELLAFEDLLRRDFGIEPGVAEDGTHFYEKWQFDEALERLRRAGWSLK